MMVSVRKPESQDAYQSQAKEYYLAGELVISVCSAIFDREDDRRRCVISGSGSGVMPAAPEHQALQSVWVAGVGKG